jgi:hypothetical protein
LWFDAVNNPFSTGGLPTGTVQAGKPLPEDQLQGGFEAKSILESSIDQIQDESDQVSDAIALYDNFAGTDYGGMQTFVIAPGDHSKTISWTYRLSGEKINS